MKLQLKSIWTRAHARRAQKNYSFIVSLFHYSSGSRKTQTSTPKRKVLCAFRDSRDWLIDDRRKKFQPLSLAMWKIFSHDCKAKWCRLHCLKDSLVVIKRENLLFRLIRQIFTFNIFFFRSVAKLKIFFLKANGCQKCISSETLSAIFKSLFSRRPWTCNNKNIFYDFRLRCLSETFSAFFQSFSIRSQGWINIATAAAFLSSLNDSKRQLITHRCQSSLPSS